MSYQQQVPPGYQQQVPTGYPQQPPVVYQQQPYQQHPQPQYGVQQVAPTQSQDWSSSLMDCSPCGTCMLGWCCPCLLLGQTSERMKNPGNPNPEMCNGDCMIMCGIMYLTGCGWIYAMIKRGEIRERFGIKGDGMNDCCASYWCPCCVLIQQEKEVIARTSGAAVTQGYQSQPGMTVGPNKA